MKHKKNQHIDKVSTCWGFIHGTCDFGDEKCWFKHSEQERIKCNMWDDIFTSKPEFHKHKKQMQRSLVEKCKKDENCKYGDFCWFLHKQVGQVNNKILMFLKMNNLYIDGQIRKDKAKILDD